MYGNEEWVINKSDKRKIKSAEIISVRPTAQRALKDQFKYEVVYTVIIIIFTSEYTH
jgi:hypothetical protein